MSSLFIVDSELAEIKRVQLRVAIYSVMKAYLLTLLKNDSDVEKPLTKAVYLEDKLAEMHTEFTNDRD